MGYGLTSCVGWPYRQVNDHDMSPCLLRDQQRAGSRGSSLIQLADLRHPPVDAASTQYQLVNVHPVVCGGHD